MATRSSLRQCVLDAKDRLAQGRAKLMRKHQIGSLAMELCQQSTDLLDTVVLDLFQAALTDVGEDDPDGLVRQIALVPHGGYGRRDVAPFSDLDLMVLIDPQVRERVEPLAKRLLMDIFDAGLSFGHSVRTPAEACQLAWSDATIFTSLTETRYLAGSVRLFTKFAGRYRRGARRRFRTLYPAIVAAREEERIQYGETVYLLEPNIKRSPGGLRDIQLLRWIGFTRYGHADPADLLKNGALESLDYRRLHEARDFLLRLRNEMHFNAKRAEDVLDRQEQLRIASLEGYPGSAGMLPVEQFMREYFHHTSEVRHVVDFFLARTRPKELLGNVLAPVLGHRVEGDFYVGQRHISTTRRGRNKLRGNPAEVLRLMDLANLYGRFIDHGTWESIRDDMMAPSEIVLTPEVKRRFLSLMSQPPRLGELLRRLHELRVLEKLVPAMRHARCLLQFNEYHKYTVDEHSFRAVEAATDFLNRSGPLGDVYRGIRQKHVLHLALLLHDLGKGYAEDHSELGGRIAAEMGTLYELPASEQESLTLLVRRHLEMSNLAFYRNTEDETVLLQFAKDVGSPENLNMLFVHTCADLAAVGPGVLNDWKLGILCDLYQRAMRRLTGDATTFGARQQAVDCRHKAQSVVEKDPDRQWLESQIELLPVSYLENVSHQEIVARLRQLRGLERTEAKAWARYLGDRQVVEYTVGTYEDVAPGIFHRLTGVLSSQGCSILSAEIHTLADALVLDRFYVEDTDHIGPPPQERLDDLCQRLVGTLEQPSDSPPTFRRVWKTRRHQTQDQLSTQPTRVQVDNTTSEEHTILDVFTNDQMGLLYTITRSLFDLGLSVWVAKIGTYVDQVVDVFYVTNAPGEKIEDEQRLKEIRRRLGNAIEELEQASK